MSEAMLEDRPGHLWYRIRDRLSGLGSREALRTILPFLPQAVKDYESYVRRFGRPGAPFEPPPPELDEDDWPVFREQPPAREVAPEDAVDDRAARVFAATLDWVARPDNARRMALEEAARVALDGAARLRLRNEQERGAWARDPWPSEHDTAAVILVGLGTLARAVDDAEAVVNGLWLARCRGYGLEHSIPLHAAFLPDLAFWLGAVEPAGRPRLLEQRRGELCHTLSEEFRHLEGEQTFEALFRFLNPAVERYETELHEFVETEGRDPRLRALIVAARRRLQGPSDESAAEALRDAASRLREVLPALREHETILDPWFDHGFRGVADQLLAIVRAALELEALADSCDGALSVLIGVVDGARGGSTDCPSDPLDAADAPDLARWLGRTKSAHQWEISQ